MVMKRIVNLCLVSGLVGVLLGSVPYAVMRLNGYELTKPVSGESAAPEPSGETAMICPMTGEPISGLGMMGGFGGPQPKRDLTTLVQKLDLLTGDIGITLTAEQAAAVNDCLRDVEKSALMSDDDAQAKHDQLMAVVNENQKARLEAIGLPQPARSDGPGMMSASPSLYNDKNPFRQDAEGKAVKSLRERLVSKGTAPKAETPKAPPAKAETPKAPPPKAEDQAT